MNRQDMALYEEARMTHGQRYQAAQDWKTAQRILLAGLFALVLLISFIEPFLI